MIGWILLALVVLLAAVLLLRTLAFRPRKEELPAVTPAEVDGDAVLNHLAEMIRCKTVSYYDKSLEDEGEFEKFRALLKTLYPAVHKACTLDRVGPSGLLYKWKGRSDKEPTVFMAHYDVVPVERELWEKDPFAGIIEDDVLWGRGTLDTKGTLCGVMESAEALLQQGYVPENDIYFAFAGDEEVAGLSAPAIVEELRKRGIVPALVVDEGGAVVENVFPGVTRPTAVVGTAEKGMTTVEFLLEGQGGHASAPPVKTPVGMLAKAVCTVEKKPFRFQITKPVAEMFDTLGRHSNFLFRMIFANLWLFKPVLNLICRISGGELNALMRTTVAFTQMEGSKATNVIPPVARIRANLRLCGQDTVDSAVAYLQQVIGEEKIRVHAIEGSNPSAVSTTDCEGWKKLKNAINQTWPEALVSPYLMMACSDSRHYSTLTDKVYRFSAMALSKEERGMIHGNNERVPAGTMVKTVQFYLRLMGQC
ncbi:MAG: M20/M25/M40 family metallo-hydrolase [Clostridiales bacterium]|nr:M20/M25/M40 family metallo-hydrolase [Clostridiales bacterium]